ncbi:MAG: hypothetical protein WD382_06715 [Halofilum sp. (in: g-proteobacteria)]
MIDAQRIALLREEFGYHADVAFATAENGTCKHGTESSRSLNSDHLADRSAGTREASESDFVFT